MLNNKPFNAKTAKMAGRVNFFMSNFKIVNQSENYEKTSHVYQYKGSK